MEALEFRDLAENTRARESESGKGRSDVSLKQLFADSLEETRQQETESTEKPAQSPFYVSVTNLSVSSSRESVGAT